MDATDGLTRGQPVADTGAQISVPFGPKTPRRILNVVGDPIDERGPNGRDMSAPIHAPAPAFIAQSTEAAHPVTGHKLTTDRASRMGEVWRERESLEAAETKKK